MGQSVGERTRYSDKFRADAVVLLKSSGWPDQPGALDRVAKHLGMKQPNVLARWAKGQQNPPPTQLVEEKQAELADLFESEMRAIFKAMGAVREDATFRDLAVALGIVTDKWQLLNGEPTQNVKNEIGFQRQGVSSLPQHLAPGATASGGGEAKV